MTQFRQGDVLLTAKSIPTGAKPVSNKGRIVLAHGEVTGHTHAVAVADAREITFTEAGSVVRRFLEVVKGAKVRHDEHADLNLPAGDYEIDIQRQYSPLAIHNVAD